MSARRKFYVVWVGFHPGIYDSWEECQAQIKNFPGAKYKSFGDQEVATLAYRGDSSEHIGILRSIANHPKVKVNYEAFPEIILDSIAVDGACAGNPGRMEYQGVNVRTGETVFKVGPLEDGTNNVGEYLALIHALAHLDKQGDRTTPVYSDSRTAQSWLRRGRSNTTLTPTSRNVRIFEMLRRADAWLASHPNHNQVIKWNTEHWGEIPADFGRK